MKDDSLNDTQSNEVIQSVGIFDSSNANMGSAKKGYAVPLDSVYTKEIWNAAIEAAALELAGDRLSQQIIRKLKK